MKFYTSIFKNSKIKGVSRYGEAGPGPKGTVMTGVFELNGQTFIVLNGGPDFKFNNAISFVVNCESQKEVDYFWKRLSKGGKEVQCGWLQDKYGLSRQIIPTILGEMLMDKDAERSQRVMKAMLGMVKINVNELKQAYKKRKRPDPLRAASERG